VTAFFVLLLVVKASQAVLWAYIFGTVLLTLPIRKEAMRLRREHLRLRRERRAAARSRDHRTTWP
jgi:hypothetical protein